MLAERFGVTVAELVEQLSHREMTEWLAFDALREQERKKAERMAGKGMRTR